MKSAIVTGSIVAWLIGSIATPVTAALSQANVTSPGGFVQAGAYEVTGSGVIAGQDMEYWVGLGEDFHEQAFSGLSSATASAAFSNDPVSASANGTVEMGRARMAAANTHMDGSQFVAGIANGGWKETFTVSHSGLTGQAGYMIFQIRARGTMDCTGLSGAAAFQTTGYKDNTELLLNPYFDRGDSDPSGSDRQRASWGLSTFGPSESRSVDSVVTMAVPITFGQSFTLGVYAVAIAGQRAQGSGATSISTSALDFSGGGLTWNGIIGVVSGGAPVAGYTLSAATDTDWNSPVGDCGAPRGDANCDGLVDFFDIDPFLTALFDLPAYAATYCGGEICSADADCGGSVDFFDIDPFLACLLGGCPPCP